MSLISFCYEPFLLIPFSFSVSLFSFFEFGCTELFQIDVDECTVRDDRRHKCDIDRFKFCKNTIGSYLCVDCAGAQEVKVRLKKKKEKLSKKKEKEKWMGFGLQQVQKKKSDSRF